MCVSELKSHRTAHWPNWTPSGQHQPWQSNWRVSRLKPCRRSHRRQQGNYLFSRKRFRSRRSHLMVLQVTGTIAFLTHPYSVIRSLGMANLPKCGKGLQRPKSSIPKPWKNAYDSFPKTPLRPRWRVTDVKWNDGVGISKSRLLWLPASISAFGRSEAFLAAVPMTGIAASPPPKAARRPSALGRTATFKGLQTSLDLAATLCPPTAAAKVTPWACAPPHPTD